MRSVGGGERFRDRAEAGRRLADRLRGRTLHRPLVLAIPRGGVVTGAALAHALGAELDVVFARKLRAPFQPELAVGAVSEVGQLTIEPHALQIPGVTAEYLREEVRRQMAEIAARARIVREVRPAAPIEGRSVLVTDDGIATGSTMIAALKAVRAGRPRELIAAVPVGAPSRLAELASLCDEVVCVLSPEEFWGVGQFYQDFHSVEDEEMIRALREAGPGDSPAVVEHTPPESRWSPE